MDFSLNDTQRLILSNLERFLTQEYGFAHRSTIATTPEGWSRDTWQELGRMGLTALPFAESAGGYGGNAVDVMLIMQAFGRALLLEPYLSSVVLAGTAIQRGVLDGQHDDLLASIASGKCIAAWAHGELMGRAAPRHVETRAVRGGDGWRLNGRKTHVLHGPCADMLLVSARRGGAEDSVGLFLVDARAAGVSVTTMRRIDGLLIGHFQLCDVPVVRDYTSRSLENAWDQIAQAEDAGTAAAVAEAVGAMEAAVRITLEYVKTRRQFGAAIGSFQVIQHRLADMQVALEQARSMAMYAAMCVDMEEGSERVSGVSAAKIVANRAARLVGDSAIQLHGGIGMTEENAIGHYARKLAAFCSSFGDLDFHARRLAQFSAELEEPQPQPQRR